MCNDLLTVEHISVIVQEVLDAHAEQIELEASEREQEEEEVEVAV